MLWRHDLKRYVKGAGIHHGRARGCRRCISDSKPHIPCKDRDHGDELTLTAKVLCIWVFVVLILGVIHIYFHY